MLQSLENGCEVCFPEEGVKYESDADDYFYDSDIVQDSESVNKSDDDNQEAEIKIEIS